MRLGLSITVFAHAQRSGHVLWTRDSGLGRWVRNKRCFYVYKPVWRRTSECRVCIGVCVSWRLVSYDRQARMLHQPMWRDKTAHSLFIVPSSLDQYSVHQSESCNFTLIPRKNGPEKRRQHLRIKIRVERGRSGSLARPHRMAAEIIISHYHPFPRLDNLHSSSVSRVPIVAFHIASCHYGSLC